jgi:hypothetical protein
VAYAYNQLMEYFVMFGAYLIVLFMGMSQSLNAAQDILTGFSVTLAFANLGFILMIIVMAIATIFQSSTYGMKKSLWKLVAMAILVNFGLVITMPIISFSNNLSNYFINEISPPGGQNGDLATTMVNAFEPQIFNSKPDSSSKSLAGWTIGGAASGAVTGAIVASFIPIPIISTGVGATVGGIIGAIAGFSKGITKSFTTQFMIDLLGMLSSGVIITIIALTLLIIGVMMGIRYVYLSVLLIVLPLAWVAWIVPDLQKHFEKWWNSFLKWTFFPVITLFFIYLALLVSMMKGTVQTQQQAVSAQTMMDIVIAGLMLGGLFAANSMGLEGAQAVTNRVKSGSKWVAGKAGGYTGKQAKKSGVALYNKAGGQKLNTMLQTSRIRPLAAAGRGLANISHNKAMVDEEMKNVPEGKEMWEKNLRGSMSDELRMAYLKKGAEKEWVAPDTMVGNQNIADYIKENKAKFANYGQNGEGNTENKLRDQSLLSTHEAAIDKEVAEKRNAELDTKRNVTDQQVQAQAGLTDEEMKKYAQLEEEDQHGELGLSPEQITKRNNIKTKLEKAKSEIGLSDAEEKEYNDNKEKIAKADGTIKKLVAGNPNLAAKIFAKPEIDPKKAQSVTLNPESIQRMQKTILSAFAKGFSPQNARGLLESIAKANNMDGFEKAVKNITSQEKDFFKGSLGNNGSNKDLRNWIQNNAGKALFGDVHKLFGIPPKSKTEG